MIWIAVSVLLLVASGLLIAINRQARADAILANLRAASLPKKAQARLADNAQAANPVGKYKARDREEIANLLARAGWAHGKALRRYQLAALLMPVALALLGAFFMWQKQVGLLQLIQGAAVGGILGFFVPRYFLRSAASRRMQAMQLEVPQFALLLRMLLDTGMTLEHAMHIMVTQADRVIPVIAAELQPVVRRMQAGQDMAESLRVFRTVFDQAELHDIFLMLRQASEQGGNVRDSITQYVEDMEKRLMAQLREYVGKLSGKMSLTMMLLLFPALLIIIAGPGMLTMVRGLSNM